MRWLLLVSALAVFGCRDRAPEPAIIAISTRLVGADSSVLENAVALPLEEAVASIEGVRSIRSYIDAGHVVMSVEVAGADVDRAYLQVQNALGNVRSRLPRELDPPVVTRQRLDDAPVISLALRGDLPIAAFSDLAETIVRTLERLPGVAAIDRRGVVEMAVIVTPDLEKLAATNVTISEVVAALRTQSMNLPAGRIETNGHDVGIRVTGQATGIEDLAKTVVRQVNGAPVRLADVAQIAFEAERKPEGREPVLAIRAQHGAQAADVVDAVRNALPAIPLPAKVTLVELSTPPPPKAPLTVSVRGPDLERLRTLADAFAKRVHASEITIVPPPGKPEIQINPDRARAADLGISLSDIAMTIGAIGGMHVASITVGDRQRDIALRAQPSIAAIARLRVRGRDGTSIPLDTVAKATPGVASAILRHDRERAAAISVRGTDDELDAARKLAASYDWPAGYRAVVQ